MTIWEEIEAKMAFINELEDAGEFDEASYARESLQVLFELAETCGQ